MTLTKVYDVIDAENGTIQEVTPQPLTESMSYDMAPYPRDHRGNLTIDPTNMKLVESAQGRASTANLPELLRPGTMFDAFSGYNEAPVTYPLWCKMVSSNKQKEEYLLDAGIGIPPVVAEGEDYPRAAIKLDSGVQIPNYKRGMIIPVTEEMRRFDQVGKIRDLANVEGRSARMGEEFAAYSVLTTTANYTRNSTTGDNDGGANQQTLTFSPTGLIEAFYVLTTMKDRTSGMYLGVQPDTLIVAPQLWWAAKQLINSPQVMRAHADDDSTVITVEKYGTGTSNAFFNVVSRIIVSPWIGNGYEWALMESGRAIYFQRVAPLEVFAPKEVYTNDTWDYKLRNWFGVGMKDDRFAFYSDSTTAPTVD
jgi:hypothetical protein